MSNTVHVPLPVQGALDTSGTVSTRAPGTLIESLDLDLLSWASRHGFTQRTNVYRAPAGKFPNPQTVVFDGTNGFGAAAMGAPEQRNLPTRWTLDLVLRPTTVTHSADALIPVFQWWLNGVEAIGVYLKAGGSAAPDRGKLVAVSAATSSPGVIGNTVTLPGVRQLSLGTLLTNTHHVRFARDGALFTLMADGLVEATTTTNVPTLRHEMSAGLATAYLGTASGAGFGGNHLFNGRIFRAMLRADAVSDPTRGMRDVSFRSGRGVRFLMHGRMTTNFGTFEQSLFQTPLNWAGVTFENVTEPAPWHSSGIQGGAYFVDVLGKGWNCVMAGGTLFAARVG